MFNAQIHSFKSTIVTLDRTAQPLGRRTDFSTDRREIKQTSKNIYWKRRGLASRPVLELKGFEKIFLEKGESKIVEFEITPEKLKFFDRNMQEVVEPGKFTIYIGKNSADLQSVELTVLE